MDSAEPLVAFINACKDVKSCQEQVLGCIVQANLGCEYLQRYQVEDKESFKANVPVVAYEDISLDIQRVVDGDTSAVLSMDPIKFFASSSGTTSGGKSKMLPLTEKAFLAYEEARMISDANIQRVFGAQSGLAFEHACQQLETKTGIKIAGGTTLVLRNEHFQKERGEVYTSPLAVAFAPLQETLYCHWLCALLQRNKVHFISHNFAYGLVEAIRFLEKEWKDICHDIRTGNPSKRVEDEGARAAVSRILRPDPELADRISGICEKSWAGVLPQLFPEAKYISAVVTGSMKPYIPALRQYAGGLHILGRSYVSSEGYMGINLDVKRQPEDVHFVMVPISLFLEFIPYSEDESTRKSLDCIGLADIRVGQMYEVVVTNFGGLYRCRVGDIVKVTGHFHQCPCIAFSHRNKAILTINWDKTDERELQQVVTKASKDCNIELVDFTSHADFSVQPGRYVIYWELKNASDYFRTDAIQKCSGILDTSFNLTYLEEREHGTIGPLLLVTVKQGTFSRAMEIALDHGVGSMQYKTPRCIPSGELLQIFCDGQVGAFESEETPKCDISTEVPGLLPE